MLAELVAFDWFFEADPALAFILFSFVPQEKRISAPSGLGQCHPKLNFGKKKAAPEQRCLQT